jgi:hypothetical protein
MQCIGCGSTAVSERTERTAQGYRRFRCHDCGKQFNERSESLLNRTQYPSDVIALVVLWRLRYKLSLRDLPEMLESMRMSGVSRCLGLGGLGRIVIGEAGIPFLEERSERAIERPGSGLQQ